jgi:thiamine monophosphate synthase
MTKNEQFQQILEMLEKANKGEITLSQVRDKYSKAQIAAAREWLTEQKYNEVNSFMDKKK